MRVRFITEDRTGALWIGTTGGMSRLKDGKFTKLHHAQGLSHEYVREIYEDADGTFLDRDLWRWVESLS